MDIIEVDIIDNTDIIDVEVTENNDVIEVTIGEGITYVKTDGVTIIGDGVITPLTSVGGGAGGVLCAIQYDPNHSYITNNGYLAGDLVWYQGKIYRAKLNNDGIVPTDTTYWENIGEGYRLQENLVDWSTLLNVPTFFSGDYNDLTNLPTLFSGSYNDLTDLPTLFSGDYNDLTNTPTIPTNTSDLTNDSGYITSSSLPGVVVITGTNHTSYQNNTLIGKSILLVTNDNVVRIPTDYTFNGTTGTIEFISNIEYGVVIQVLYV